MTYCGVVMAGNAFGVWLERQLRSREMNQSEFARKLGMKQGMVSNWVRGARIPDPGSCDRIADALGLSINAKSPFFRVDTGRMGNG